MYESLNLPSICLQIFSLDLDFRFMESIFKGVPQVTLQLYIVFYTAITYGTYSLVVLVSSAISLVALASVLCMLYDRAQIRLISMAPAENNPPIIQSCAKLLTALGVGVDGETVKELANFNVRLSDFEQAQIHHVLCSRFSRPITFLVLVISS